MSAPLLELRGLAKTYRVEEARIEALRGVDLAIGRGEIVAVVGESGSGKTTLGNLVLGIEPPTAGTIELEGTPIPPDRSRALRRKLQLVPQNPLSALNPKRTIFQSVSLPLAVHDLVARPHRRARVAELLETVGLPPDCMDRHPRVLSGGQRQRVALARALAAEPDAIVLDEPTSALDVSVQARILGLLEDLQQRHRLSYIFITHDLGVVRTLAHRVAVLFRGLIVEMGPTRSVFADPRHRYTQMLLSSVPVVTEEEERMKPDWPWDRELVGRDDHVVAGCRFRLRCPYAVEPCASIEPPLAEQAPAHFVRCHNPRGSEVYS